MIPLDASIGLILHCCCFFLCIATDGIRERGAFVVSVSPMSAQNWQLSAQTKTLPSRVTASIEPSTLYENTSSEFRRGKGQPSTIPTAFFFFSSRHTSEDVGKVGEELTPASSLVVALRVLVIKNNNAVLSPPLAGDRQRKTNRTHRLGHMLAQTWPLNFLSIILAIYPPLRHIWGQVASEHVVSVSR